MNTHVVLDVGDPPASSLSSCLRSFPGGVSLLTETGHLRAYFVAAPAAPGAAPPPPDNDDGTPISTPSFVGTADSTFSVTSAIPLEVSTSSPQGSFPADQDIPIDHAWSKDGAVLVVLRRASFTVYSREDHHPCRRTTSSTTSEICGGIGNREGSVEAAKSAASTAGRIVCSALSVRAGRASLGLAKVHSGRNRFEGKAVTCCPVPRRASGSTRRNSHCEGGKQTPRGGGSSGGGGGGGGCYLVAVGGSFGIECHLLEASLSELRNAKASDSIAAAEHCLQGTTATTAELFPNVSGKSKMEPDVITPLQGSRFPFVDTHTCTTTMSAATAVEAEAAAAAVAAVVPQSLSTWTCRFLTCLFDGYPVVTVEFAPDSKLLAAAAMTGHVKLWNVLGLLALIHSPPPKSSAPPLPQRANSTPTQASGSRESALSGGGNSGKWKHGQRRKQGQQSPSQSPPPPQREYSTPTLASASRGSAMSGGGSSSGKWKHGQRQRQVQQSPSQSSPPPQHINSTPTRTPGSRESALSGGGSSGKWKHGQRRKQGQRLHQERKWKGSPASGVDNGGEGVGGGGGGGGGGGSLSGGLGGIAALWSTTLPMARPTSLSFSPSNNSTLALACWDGQIIILRPAATAPAAAPTIDESTPLLKNGGASRLLKTPKTPVPGKSAAGAGDTREWTAVWREQGALSKKESAHPEDQDGAFVCWCDQGDGQESGRDDPHAAEAATMMAAIAPALAISSYGVTLNDTALHNPENLTHTGVGFMTPGSPTAIGFGPAFDGNTAAPTGPGLEVFAGEGLGDQVGGVIIGVRGGLAEATAERYLIHGMAAGLNYLALYDSDRCLQLVSLGAMLEAGRVLTPQSAATTFASSAVRPADATQPPPAVVSGLALWQAVDGLSAGRDKPPMRTRDTDSAVGAVYNGSTLEDSPDKEQSSSKAAAAPKMRALANNDHGLVKAEVLCCHPCDQDLENDQAPSRRAASCSDEDSLGLSITWRDALTRLETPDNGECSAVAAGGEVPSGNTCPRLPFLPALREEAEDSNVDGVIAADVRWGHMALFSRFTALVYTRPVSSKSVKGGERGRVVGGGEAEGSSAGAGRGVGGGGWRAYPEGPVVHASLLGGASTAPTPPSARLPKPPADLAHLYLLALLEGKLKSKEISEKVPRFFVSIRSLSDRNVCCRCPLPMDVGSDGDDKNTGIKIYVSPGYGGGVFVVANPSFGVGGVCARIWRGTFDEAACRMVITPSRVINSSPWPAPETLCLQGVAGPNCELVLFKLKEENVDCSHRGNEGDWTRWWITWPEKDIWRDVDAPRTLAGEDLTVSDFVTIFQQLVEAMIMTYEREQRP